MKRMSFLAGAASLVLGGLGPCLAQSVTFAVQGTNSYVKNEAWAPPGPQAWILPGGTIEARFDSAGVMTAHGTDLRVSVPTSAAGDHQVRSLHLTNAQFSYNTADGRMVAGLADIELAASPPAGPEKGQMTDVGSSRILDANSGGAVELTNGLGVGQGGLVLDLSVVWPSNGVVHFEAIVQEESLGWIEPKIDTRRYRPYWKWELLGPPAGLLVILTVAYGVLRRRRRAAQG